MVSGDVLETGKTIQWFYSMTQPLSLDSARALIDFSGGGASIDIASDQQLEGSLALHNLLTQEAVCLLGG